MDKRSAHECSSPIKQATKSGENLFLTPPWVFAFLLELLRAPFAGKLTASGYVQKLGH